MARFGGHTVHEFDARGDDESDDMDQSNVVATKLHAHQRGMLPATRMRKISYVQRSGDGGGGGGGGPGRIADLVILNQYDEDGNLAHKGTCIVKGVQHKIRTLNTELNPMTTYKDGSTVKVEMGYQIIDDQPKKSQRSSSARRSKDVLERDAADIPLPSEFPNKSMAVNEPAMRTRSEATPWLETHKDGKRQNLNHTLYSVRSLNVPLATINSMKNFPDVNTTFVDVESAAKANNVFRERDSFKERENIPMSRRRRLARQPPARQRVRLNPSTGAAQRAVPRVDKTSPPVSPRVHKAQGVGHVRFGATDAIRPSSVISHMSSIHGPDFEGHEGANRRLNYSPGTEAVDYAVNPGVTGVSASAPNHVPPLATRDLATHRLGDTSSYAEAGEREPGRYAASAGAATEVARAHSAPQVARAPLSAGGGSSAGGIQSARESQAERNSALLRHVNAAHSKRRISDKTWSNALEDLDAKTKTRLELLDRVVYVKKERDVLGTGPAYERPTVSASLKLQNAYTRGRPSAGWLSARTLKGATPAIRHPSRSSTQAAHVLHLRPQSARAVLNTRPISRPPSGKGTNGEAADVGAVVQGNKRSTRPASAYVTRTVASHAASEKFRARPLSAGVARKSHADMLLPYPNRDELLDRQGFGLEKP